MGAVSLAASFNLLARFDGGLAITSSRAGKALMDPTKDIAIVSTLNSMRTGLVDIWARACNYYHANPIYQPRLRTGVVDIWACM